MIEGAPSWGAWIAVSALVALAVSLYLLVRARRLQASAQRENLRLQTRVEEIEIISREKEESVRAMQDFVLKARRDLEEREKEAESRWQGVRRREEAIDRVRRYYRARLEKLSRSTPEEVERRLRETIAQEVGDELRGLRQSLLDRGETEIQEEARRTLVACMQRLAARPNEDITATLVELPGEDMKGRIIGREGRNIRAFETATGVTLMIDETPGSVLVSSFDPVRREVARIALQALMKDGRIHPVTIEEAVHKAEKEMQENVITFGEKALQELRLARVHPEVVQLLGRLHYRLSNNQNSLGHSIEVAGLCGLLASELGLDPEPAKRAGLFHDIGKAVSQEYDGSHARVGAQILKRCGEMAAVVNAVAAHHNEVPAESHYAALVMTADAVSATRPGARADALDSYIQRVRSLEKIAREQPGVTEAFAIQAGREIRVMVEPGAVSDEDARSLARRLRSRIEEELEYPGTIKVTVIREQRYTETAS